MKSKIMLILSLLFLTYAVQAQNADEILAKYFENTGGIKKWKNLKTIKMDGTFPTPQGDFDFTIYRKSPDMVKLQVEVHGQVIVPQAYDGEVAWAANPMMGGGDPQKLPEEATQEVAANAEFQDAFIDYKKKGHEVSYEGIEEVDSMKVYVLKLEKNKNNDKSNMTEYHYFDTKQYWPVMIKTTALSGPAQGAESRTYLHDYQKTKAGLTMPYRIETKVNGQTVNEIVIDKIEINEKISDNVFAFPGNSSDSKDGE